ncbi:dolichyl-phosphate-mannose--protein mannosyltransferase [Microbacterium gorillae]|uniref:dolichyl-phosphate-mannose--protein mannosyltransferase n=1 Tax=Microbacterium gorillae TaxID=1231063 RepID=UPI000694CB07|nr:phospholipid carrier-dependent glycosyltransferase [Microbacterium gorillae]
MSTPTDPRDDPNPGAEVSGADQGFSADLPTSGEPSGPAAPAEATADVSAPVPDTGAALAVTAPTDRPAIFRAPPAPVATAPGPDTAPVGVVGDLPGYAQHTPFGDRVRAWMDQRRATSVRRDLPSRWFGRREWIVPLIVVIVAALVRFIGLGHPATLIFDETYYVKDAWSLWHLGYEGSWPDGADAKFAAGDTMIFTDVGSRVVHPPLGKWLIALGMVIFGNGADPFGWRFMTALLGVGTVLVTYLIARRLTGSVVWAGLAGGFLAIDGLSIVLSRVSLLDGILTFFVMLGVLFIIYDHRGAMSRIANSTDLFTGPTMWARPWLIAAGAAFGAAAAVKWSGFYMLAAFGVYLVVADALARRRAGIQMWGSTAIGRQAPATFVLFVPIAVVVYMLSWLGWLTTSGGYFRDTSPNPLIAFWNYQLDTMSFHVGLSTPHTYMSPAWQWPFLIRPTSMYWNSADCTDAAGGTYNCVQAITPIPNPLLWWVGVIAALVILYGVVRYRDWRYAIVLVGLGAAYLPWLAVPDRTIFQFYTVLMMPFMMIALVLALQRVCGPGPRPRRLDHRAWRSTTWVLAIVAVLISAFFLPLWTGMEIPYQFWLVHMWFPSWV